MAWTAGTNPNAVLVNEMLVQAVSKLKDDEHPIVHTDRGCQVARPDRTYGEELVDSQCLRRVARRTILLARVSSVA